MRPFVSADVPAALALMHASLGAGRAPRTETYFRWKHLESPFGPSIGLVEDDVDNGGLLGLRLLQRWRLCCRGLDVHAVRAVDTATAPRAQGRGLFRALTLAAVDVARADLVDVVFNTPNDKSGAGYLKMGWLEVGKPGVFARPAGLLPRLARTSSELDHDVDPAHVARALAPARDDHRLRTRHDEASLRWRYVDIPGLRYRQGRVGGATAVYRRQRRRGLPELTVVELAHPASARGVLDAVRLLRALAREGGALALTAMAPIPSSTSAALVAAGFAWVPIGPRLMTRPVSMTRLDAVPARLTRWGLAAGDLELF